jgi:hypothetical protein
MILLANNSTLEALNHIIFKIDEYILYDICKRPPRRSAALFIANFTFVSMNNFSKYAFILYFISQD